MNTDVLKEFLDKNVELSTNNKTYTGSLKHDVFHGVLIVTPVEKYQAKRFGPATVNQDAVIAIRVILPQVEVSLGGDRVGYFQGDDSSEESAG